MKTKTIQITEETHTKFKDYCKRNNLKINSFIDTILDQYVEKLNEEERKNLDEKVSKSKQ
ncbi:MAG: hypothetical protein JETCAE03_32550 [Ignavibacteriaceae bacterium]|nr:MAG: hypothetical protein JETCAE03_32550 [Ignavibacteriaceae bacterium]